MDSVGSAQERPLLEVCVEDAAQTLSALNHGADRIELCADLSVGGLSPSLDTIAAVISIMDAYYGPEVQVLPLMIMIRPRPGHFFYSDTEVQEMEQLIDNIKRHVESAPPPHSLKHKREACFAGFVFGCLLPPSTSIDPLVSPSTNIDLASTKRVLQCARPYKVTFHRAFDEVSDKVGVLKQLALLGVDRVLTSGGPGSVDNNMPTLSLLFKESQTLEAQDPKGIIKILPGGGVRPHNAKALLALGALELHSSVPFVLNDI